MAAQPRRLVLLPRFTSLAGTSEFLATPINVRPYARAIFSTWRSRGLGTTEADIALTIEDSADLETWRLLHAITLVPSDEVTTQVQFSVDWMRIKAVVSGSDPALTCWMVGDFVPRD